MELRLCFLFLILKFLPHRAPSQILTLSLRHFTHSHLQRGSLNMASGFYQAGVSSKCGSQRSTPKVLPVQAWRTSLQTGHQIPATITLLPPHASLAFTQSHPLLPAAIQRPSADLKPHTELV